MEWKKLLSEKRAGTPRPSRKKGDIDLRSEFEKDYHRIVSSASFRRLQDKTQVFPLDKSDFIRTRLTHSLEVSSLAKSLGQNISEYIIQNHMAEDFTYRMKEDVGTVLMCAGLIHDIGNPPFGHFGEDSIREWFQNHLGDYRYKGTPVTELLSRQMLRDLYYFEGNAQAFRLVTKLHYLVNEHGMNLTYGLLSTMIKYPVSSTEMEPGSGDVRREKMGYFLSEENIFHEISRETGTGGARHPLSYILEAADDIAYLTADVEDAFKKGCISYDILIRELNKELAAYPAAEDFDSFAELERLYRRGKSVQSTEPKLYAVQNWLVKVQSYLISCATRGFISHYDEIMAGAWASDIFFGTGAEGIRAALHNIAFRNAFESIPILRIEVGAGKMMDDILERLIPAFILYDTDEKIGMIEHKMTQLVSENYRQIYHFYSEGKSEAERLYLRLLLVTDYVSGMTDSFARDLYQEVNGIL